MVPMVRGLSPVFRKKKEGQRKDASCTVSQVPLSQNNQHAQVAYFGGEML